MGKIKILYFVDALGDGGGGGIQTLLLNIVEYINKEMYQVDILKFDLGNDKLDDVFIELGCRIFTIPDIKSNIFQSLSYMNKFFKNHNEYHILHCHSSSKSAFPLFYARKYGINIRITHSHCTKFQTKSFFQKMIGTFLMIPNSIFATEYFACSNSAKNWMFKKWYISKKKYRNVKIIDNGIDLKKYRFNSLFREEIRKEFNIDEQKVVIGSVARFRNQKNHTFMIDIMHEILKKNNNVFLILVGTGELQQVILNKVKKYGIEKNVIFAGNRRDVNKLLNAFDVFLMPSFMEGLPFAGIEAQASGLKCIFSNNITEEIKILDSSEFLSLNAPIEEWIKSILEISDIESRKNAHLCLKEKGYDVQDSVQNLQNIYFSLVNGG